MPLSWSGITGGSLAATVKRAADAEADNTAAEVEAEEEYRRLESFFRQVREEDAKNAKKSDR
eukprot:251230-Rhodomonas_salina.1